MTWFTGDIPKTSDKWSNFSRVKVDAAQTSFFEGREFRSFKELNIPALTTYVIRAIVPQDIILYGLTPDIESGWLRMGTYLGGTPGGTFSETLPALPRNNMSVGGNRLVALTSTIALTAGGTHSGGTELDVLRVKTGSNVGNQASSSVGVTVGDERGVGAGTYYFRLQNLHATDAVVGTLHVSWEERVAVPASGYGQGV